MYHLCDDTTHDATFIHFVLEDIIGSRNVMNENVLMKSDNAHGQYQHKSACSKFTLKTLTMLAIVSSILT